MGDLTQDIDNRLIDILEDLRIERDQEKDPARARHLSIIITDTEKLLAYYEYYLEP